MLSPCSLELGTVVFLDNLVRDNDVLSARLPYLIPRRTLAVRKCRQVRARKHTIDVDHLLYDAVLRIGQLRAVVVRDQFQHGFKPVMLQSMIQIIDHRAMPPRLKLLDNHRLIIDSQHPSMAELDELLDLQRRDRTIFIH